MSDLSFCIIALFQIANFNMSIRHIKVKMFDVSCVGIFSQYYTAIFVQQLVYIT